MTDLDDTDLGSVILMRDAYSAERAALDKHCAVDVEITSFDFATGPGLSFCPQNPSGPDILYFHGGGWTVGSPETHKNLCSWLAHFSGVRVFSAPYGLAPEHKFPQQALDAVAVLDGFCASRKSVILAGDSAGAAMALWAENGTAFPRNISAIASFYGAFHVLDSETINQPNGIDGLDRQVMKDFFRYLGCEKPDQFQARINQHGAPMLLVTAGIDPLRGDADWLKAHRQSRVDAMDVAGQPHAFLHQAGIDPVVTDIMRNVGQWIKKVG